MRKIGAILALLTVALLALTLFNAVSLVYADIPIQRELLQYDDGTYEREEAWPAGYMIAVNFTPPKPSLLRTLQFYITASPATFEVHLMNATTHQDLVTPFEATPPHEFVKGWLTINLPRHKIVPIVSGDFIVALKFVSSYIPAIGSDTSAPIAGRSEIYNPYDATWTSYPTNLMIRAEIIYIS
jgi:hypothetical protein